MADKILSNRAIAKKIEKKFTAQRKFLPFGLFNRLRAKCCSEGCMTGHAA